MASPYVASGSLSQEDLHRMLSPRLAKLSAERERDQPSLRNRRPTGTSANVDEVDDYNVRSRSLPDQFRGNPTHE
ncbi:hypothetical protein COOONC_12840 [Cooperia oncophora]